MVWICDPTSHRVAARAERVAVFLPPCPSTAWWWPTRPTWTTSLPTRVSAARTTSPPGGRWSFCARSRDLRPRRSAARLRLATPGLVPPPDRPGAVQPEPPRARRGPREPGTSAVPSAEASHHARERLTDGLVGGGMRPLPPRRTSSWCDTAPTTPSWATASAARVPGALRRGTRAAGLGAHRRSAPSRSWTGSLPRSLPCWWSPAQRRPDLRGDLYGTASHQPVDLAGPVRYVQALEVTGPSERSSCAGQTSSDADGNPVHAGRDMRAQVRRGPRQPRDRSARGGIQLSHVVRLTPTRPVTPSSRPARSPARAGGSRLPADRDPARRSAARVPGIPRRVGGTAVA